MIPRLIGGPPAGDRWDRIVNVLLVVSLLFVAFTINAIIQGDDLREIVMTIVPGLICVALWRLAVWRRDR